MNSKNLNAAAHSAMATVLNKEQQKKYPELPKALKSMFVQGAQWRDQQPANNLPKYQDPPPAPAPKDSTDALIHVTNQIAALRIQAVKDGNDKLEHDLYNVEMLVFQAMDRRSERESRLWHTLARLVKVSATFKDDLLQPGVSLQEYQKVVNNAREVLKGEPYPATDCHTTDLTNSNTKTMNVQMITYEKCFPLGGYSNEKIGIAINLAPGDDPLDAYAEAKKQVEKSHKFFHELPTYERAKQIVADPMSYTGREVEANKEFIEMFEANYPDYLRKFVPASRKLTEGRQDDDYNEQD